MLKRVTQFSMFILISVLQMVPTIGQGLPNFKLEKLSENTTRISWKNQFKDKCSQISIQRAYDKNSFFHTVFSPRNPKESHGSYIDTNRLNSKEVYYRIFYAVDGGNYYDFSIPATKDHGVINPSDEVTVYTDIKAVDTKSVAKRKKEELNASLQEETEKEIVEPKIAKSKTTVKKTNATRSNNSTPVGDNSSAAPINKSQKTKPYENKLDVAEYKSITKKEEVENEITKDTVVPKKSLSVSKVKTETVTNVQKEAPKTTSDTIPKSTPVSSTIGLARIGGATGKITGKIINTKTGDPISGATLTLKSGEVTRVARSDYNGIYTVSELPEGVYTINVSHLTYGKKLVEDVKIIKKDVTTQDITMQESKGKNLEEVVVTTKGAGRIKESVAALLIQQKNSASVSDGISAEAIKRTPDKTTSDIMKRVSGASIQDDKFVIIRGLNDRYNAAFINNSPLPSSESDRKAFSFDVFPANMLDNLVIVKTATPDVNGEFAGGLIFINTKDIPAKDFQSITFGLGYNTQATFKNRKYEKAGRWDWVGLDDGTRALSPNIPSTNLASLSKAQQGQIGKSISNNWSPYSGVAPANYNFQYVKGLNIQKNQKDYLGVLFSATYSKTFNLVSGKKYSLTGFSENFNSDFDEKTYSSQVLAGLMGNVSLKLNSNNKISFKNLLSVNTDDRIINRDGDPELQSDGSPSTNRSSLSAQWFTSNVVLSSQLNGEHFLSKPKIKINWTGGYTSVERQIPNLRKMGNSFITDNPTDVKQSVNAAFSVGNNFGSGCFFTSSTKESIKNLSADLSRMYRINNFNSIQLKAGAYIQGRNREFAARYLSIVKLDSFPIKFDETLLNLPDDKVFAAKNFGRLKNGKYGFGLSEDYKADNKYTASSFLTAYYLMLDTRFFKFIRLNGGLRIERFNQVLTSASSTLNTTITDHLPSANLIFSLNSKQNLRFSYSQTLNRPEYRELAPFIFYDYVTNLSIYGNTQIERVKIENYDCRYEFYPTGGQLLSLSYFQKNIPNPIEFVITPNSDATYINASKGKITGVEFECRTNIGTTFKARASSFLTHTTLFGNAAFINSEVSFGIDSTKYGGTRSMQGQSAFMYNAGATYQDENGYSGTLQVNYSSPRIFIGGGTDNPAIMEKGRSVLDLQLTKNFEKQNIELKLNVKDILAQDFVRFYDINKNGTYEKDKDKTFISGQIGRVISATLSYKF